MNTKISFYDNINFPVFYEFIEFFKTKINENSNSEYSYNICALTLQYDKEDKLKPYRVLSSSDNYFDVRFSNLDELTDTLKNIKYCESCVRYTFRDPSKFSYNDYCENCSKVIFFKNSKYDDVCSICLEDINSALIRQVECGHFIHYKCFRKLLKLECPLCKVRLRYGDEDSFDEDNNEIFSEDENENENENE
jgi:hypothetical protein